MTRVERMKKYLKEEFGIENEQQLNEAFKKLPPLDVGMMTRKPHKNKE